jgi:DegV family protein with EDD domain
MAPNAAPAAVAVAVVTDSLAWIPEPVVRQHGIRVVPLHVRFGAEEHTETIDITPGEFYQRLRDGAPFPKTSQPAVGEFLAVYRELANDVRAIVSVHASSKLSGTYNAANIAAQQLREEHPDVQIETLDTLQIATAQGIVAMRCAELAASGARLEDILTEARGLIPKPRVLLAVDSLDFLQRGGRVGRAQAFLGGLLQVRPILTVTNGEVAPVERVRTRRRAVERMLELVAKYANGRPLAHVGVGHAAAHEAGSELLEAVRERFSVGTLLYAEIGPVIGTYVGPGALALTYHCE